LERGWRGCKRSYGNYTIFTFRPACCRSSHQRPKPCYPYCSA